MIELIFGIAYAVFFIHVTTWEGHIWEKVANWLDRVVPEIFQKPLYACPICMTPWWGFIILLALYFMGEYDFHWVITPLMLFAAAGINAVNAILAKWFQKLIREEEEWEKNAGQYMDN